jgi:RNA polymerase sigma-70 factor (ECF subfamily)
MSGAGTESPWPPEDGRDFRTTHWSVVLAAGREQSAQASDALAALCRAYWPPLYGYARRLGNRPEDAQDLTQAFFARLLQRGLIAQANRERGRFRTFLLTAFRHFLVSEWEKQRAVQRGGRYAFVSWEQGDLENGYLAENPGDVSPESAFEKRWAASLLEAVLRRLRAEAEAGDRVALFERLKDYLWGDSSEVSYGSIASELGLTPTAVKVAAHRLRQRFREVLRAEIAHTVASETEIEEEMRYLFAVVSG